MLYSTPSKKQNLILLAISYLMISACSTEKQLYATTELNRPASNKKVSGNSATDANASERNVSTRGLDSKIGGQTAENIGVIGQTQNPGPATPSLERVLAGGDGQRIESVETNEITASGEKLVSRAYLSSRIVDGVSRFTTQSQQSQSQLTMRRESLVRSQAFNQATRDIATEIFTQGATGQLIEESITQSNLGVLDVMIVVDDSGSMKAEQDKLSSKLQPLLSKIENSDWRIGVITTSKSKPTLRGIINRGDSNAANAFSSAVSPGTSGESQERGVYQAVQGLKSSGFLRPNSSVAVLIVSDEDNCSTGENGCANEESRSASYLLNYLSERIGRPLGTQARVYGLIWKPGTSCSSGYNEGRVYMQAIEASGGQTGSICDADYTSTLAAISENVQTILKKSWSLKQVPEAGSLKVLVNGSELSSGFTLSQNTVTFSMIPPANSSVKFIYRVGSTPTFTAVNLSSSVYPESETVTVNGNALKRGDDYQVATGMVSQINFKAAPPALSKVIVNYKKNQSLQSSFPLRGEIVPQSIVASVVGIKIPVTYDSNSQTINFALAPPEGASIAVSFVELGAALLAYPLNLGSSVPAELTAVDAATNAPLQVSYTPSGSSGTITFNGADFVDGRRIEIRHLSPMTQMGSYSLPVNPISGTTSVVPDQGLCFGLNAFSVNGNVLTLSCPLPDNTGFIAHYKSIESVRNLFSIDSLSQVECTNASWEVFVNGVASLNSFVRTGCSFVTASVLPPGSVVKIEARVK